ncbi:YciI family protein [Spirillospora sp. CA-294931]|uniref:YciI family protein n=1 Tax=Spirillospora sp. CA-294931 TaxID=3240042 RepID=UPI003D90253C
MFAETEEFLNELAAMSDDDRQAAYEAVSHWFTVNAAKITHHQKLAAPDTATTMRLSGGDAVVTDGPFIEGKEGITGYAEIDVADLDEALALARTWPACPIVEIRPFT